MPETSRVRVADLVAQYLVEVIGLSDCFCVTGAGIMHLTDGLSKEKRLRTIFPHHEQTSSMAVDAFTRVSGKVGVAFFSTGPAATNALTGLAGCWQDSVPALFISGQVKRSESSHFTKQANLRQFGVQELNILPMVETVTKYAVQISDPNDIYFELDKAIYSSLSGRPGPSWIEIPMDVQGSYVDKVNLKRFKAQLVSNKVDSSSDFERIISEIELAKRPLVIAGHGIRLSKSVDQFLDFSSKNSIPFVTPYLGIDISPKNHRNNIGVTGVKGDRVANWAMQTADYILILGSSMHVSVTGYEYNSFAPQAKKSVIDIDLTSHNKNLISYDIQIEDDLRNFFNFASRKYLGSSLDRTKWINSLNQLRERYPVIQDYNDVGEVNIYDAIRMVNSILEPNDVVVSDAGSAFYAVSQALAVNHNSQRYITSGAMATMGFSLPAAIGCATSTNDRVFAFTGDGSFQQNMQELSLLAHHHFNIKLLVLNNDGYLSIRASQSNYYENRFFGTDIETGLPMPNLSKIAKAFELPYVSIKSEQDFIRAKGLLSQKGPLIVEFFCPRNQKIIPTVGSILLSDGSLKSASLSEMSPPLQSEELEMILKTLAPDLSAKT